MRFGGDTLERGPTRTVVATPQELKIFGELRDAVRPSFVGVMVTYRSVVA